MTNKSASNTEQLKRRLLALSALVEENANRCVLAIRQRDRAAANRVIASDVDVDKLEIAIEEDCVHLLLSGDLSADDIRMIVAVLKVNADLERIGDLSSNISKRVLRLGEHDQLVLPNELMTLAEKTMHMVRSSLDALVNMDADLAREVCARDNEVDQLHHSMHDLIRIRISENPSQTERFLHVLSISRYLERIADYSTNIAENVVYVQEETIIRHHHEGDRVS